MTSGFPGTRTFQFVHHEFDKAHQDLASKAMGLKKKLSDLESEKARVYAEAKAQTGIDTTGVDALKPQARWPTCAGLRPV